MIQLFVPLLIKSNFSLSEVLFLLVEEMPYANQF